MPELPEVESVKIQLNKFLVGHTVEKVEVRYKKCLQGDSSKLKNAKVKGVRRFGKVTVIDFSNDYSAVIHIKLTGQLIYRGPKLTAAPPLSSKVIDGLGGKHTHIIFHFDKDGKLFYNDVRRFGWIKIEKTKDVETIDFIKKLGPEPAVTPGYVGQEFLTLEKFRALLSSTKRSIKTLLMDQSKIGGIGNIYAIDALWLAEIHPETSANKLPQEKVEELHKAIETVLKRGLEFKGASELSFVTPDGSEGQYQKHFLAYGKDGEICTRCNKGKFVKVRLAGRGTVYCPECQKKI